MVQSQAEIEQIAPGFEAIAQAVVSTLRELSGAGLDPDDQRSAQGAAEKVLAEVVEDEPDQIFR